MYDYAAHWTALNLEVQRIEISLAQNMFSPEAVEPVKMVAVYLRERMRITEVDGNLTIKGCQ